MEFEQLERFTAFLKENLSTPDFDEDAYLERLIIHWGETGALRFTLSAEETVSGCLLYTSPAFCSPVPAQNHSPGFCPDWAPAAR